jgi:ferric-dicitrate binding protein FerR (iron transport regulator)
MEYNEEHIRLMMIERLAGTIEAPEDEALEALIRSNATVRRQWQALQEAFDTPAAKTALDTLPERQQRVWEHIAEQRDVKARRRFKVARMARIVRIAVAAAVLAAVAAGTLYFLQRPKDQPLKTMRMPKSVQLKLANGQTINISGAGKTISLGAGQLQNTNKTLSFNGSDDGHAGTNVLTVPVGMDYKIVLSDNTEVWLNALTTLRFPFKFGGSTREISINGEAYLKVARDEKHPFIVHTPRSSIQVLGTAFNINSYDSGQVKVSLVDGAVQLKAGNGVATLKPGQQGICEGGRTITIQPFDEKDILSWMQGIQVFYNAPVHEINSVLARWYGVTVVLDNPRLASERFTGFIERNKPLKVFLDQMKMTTALDYYFEDGVLHLK